MEKTKNFTPKVIADKVIRIIIVSLLIVYSLSLLVPVYWMIINSFKGFVEHYQTNSFSFPEHITLENYEFILKNMSYKVNAKSGSGKIVYTLPWMFFYSVLWSVGSSAFAVFLSTMCAYVMAKYKFPGREFLYSLGIIIMIMPIIGSSGALLLIRKQLHVYNSMLMMIITSPSTAFSGVNFLILYAAFKGIPSEYAEAVHMDGGGHLTVFLRIMLPMAMSSIWVLILLGIIASWNDYMTFLMWLPSYGNIAMGVYNFQYISRMELGTTMPQILASFVIVALPIVIIYIGFQKIITANFLVGGLKG